MLNLMLNIMLSSNMHKGKCAGWTVQLSIIFSIIVFNIHCNFSFLQNTANKWRKLPSTTSSSNWNGQSLAKSTHNA